ncbi:hypothetical protein JCM8547_006995 [Rhodosporidiobolus lusitaniae]
MDSPPGAPRIPHAKIPDPVHPVEQRPAAHRIGEERDILHRISFFLSTHREHGVDEGVGRRLSLVHPVTQVHGQQVVFRSFNLDLVRLDLLTAHLVRYSHLARYVDSLVLPFLPTRDHLDRLGHLFLIACNLQLLRIDLEQSQVWDYIAHFSSCDFWDRLETLNINWDHLVHPAGRGGLDVLFGAMEGFTKLNSVTVELDLDAAVLPRNSQQSLPLRLEKFGVHIRDGNLRAAPVHPLIPLFSHISTASLRRLHLHIPFLTNHEILFLQHFTSLEELTVVSTRDTAAPGLLNAFLPVLPHLRTLTKASFLPSNQQPTLHTLPYAIPFHTLLASLPPSLTSLDLSFVYFASKPEVYPLAKWQRDQLPAPSAKARILVAREKVRILVAREERMEKWEMCRLDVGGRREWKRSV